MFWLLDKDILDNYEFIMEFLNYEKINIDNNIIYIFNNKNINNNISNTDEITIICNIKIKENIILYSYNDKKICFSFIKEEYYNEPHIKYYYKKETIDKMPYLLSEKYDFNNDITFIIKINNNNLLIKDSLGRLYNIKNFI